MPSTTFVAGQPLTAAELNQIGKDSDWITISSFTNSWTAGSRAPQYRKIGNRVQLRGLIVAGGSSAGNSAFLLPNNYKPTQNHLFAVGNSAGGTSSVTVGSDGTVVGNTGGSTWSLDTISFYVD